ncbi:MAG: S41 family peptidase [Planctomycetota bacterium]|nr:S41 family peptidase [Planctomycetota bacterium]
MQLSFRWTRWAIAAAAGAAVVMAVAGCRSARPQQDPGRDLRARTFDCYWTALRNDYPYFEAVGVDWCKLRDQYRERAITAPDTFTYYRVMSEMFAKLQDPHLVLTTRRAKQFGQSDRYDWIAPTLVQIGRNHYIWSWSDTGGCLGVDSGSYPQLLSRGGVAWTRFSFASDLAFLEPVFNPDSLEAIDVDGERLRVDPQPRASPSKGLVDRVIGVRDFRRNFMEGTPFEVPGTGQASVEVVIEDQRLHRSPISQMAFRGIESRDKVSPSLVPGAARPWWIQSTKRSGVSYMRLSSFSAYAGDERSPSRFGAVLARDMPAMLESPCMIIDLRYNTGGNRSPVQEALNWFSARPITLRLSQWKAMQYDVRQPVVFKVDPVPFPFRGKVVVLVNRFSASAAEVFAQFMREHNGAVVIGETTIGAEAGVETLRGPDGSTLSYGSVPFRYPGAPSFQTCGLVPDVQVPLTIERVREIGYAPAVLENEIEQMRAACRVLELDEAAVLAGTR